VEKETLAYKLGTTTHLSPLLMKARRLGLHGPEALEALAVQRGCRYYAHSSNHMRVAEESPAYGKGGKLLKTMFSNEELAIALLSLNLPKSQGRLRIGAAMLAAEGNSVQRLVRLSIQERLADVVRYIADCGLKVEPNNEFWQKLLDQLPPRVWTPREDDLPHITRFVAMTGFTRRGVLLMRLPHE
jgi:hypothetical protein